MLFDFGLTFCAGMCICFFLLFRCFFYLFFFLFWNDLVDCCAVLLMLIFFYIKILPVALLFTTGKCVLRMVMELNCCNLSGGVALSCVIHHERDGRKA